MREHGIRARRTHHGRGFATIAVLLAGCAGSWKPTPGDPPARPIQSEALCLERVEPFLTAPPDAFDLSAALIALSADIHEDLLESPFDAQAARDVLDEFLSGCESALGNTPDAEGLTRHLFETLALEPILTGNQTSGPAGVAEIFPDRVLESRRGACLGLSALYLIAARRLQLPIKGVLVNTHFFIRDEGERLSTNFETLRRGHHHADAYYARKFGVLRDSPLSLKSLDDRESFAAFLFNVANAYRDGGRAGDAIRIYERVLGILPAFAEARGNMAILDLEAGNVELAVRELNAVLRTNPNLVRAYVGLCVAYSNSGDLVQAEAVCRAGLRTAPQSGDLHHALGIVLHKDGRVKAAITSYRRAVTFAPDLAAAHANLAKAYQAQGEAELAADHIRLATDLVVER